MKPYFTGFITLRSRVQLPIPLLKGIFSQTSLGCSSKSSPFSLAFSELYEYDVTTNQLKAQSVLELDQPIVNYTPAAVSGNTFTKHADFYMNRINISDYTVPVSYAKTIVSKRNIISEIRSEDLQYSIATATNATANDISYNSFEPKQRNDWYFQDPSGQFVTTDAVTGKTSLNLSTYLVRTRANSITTGKTYALTFWAKNASPVINISPINGYQVIESLNSGWQLYRATFVGQNTYVQFTGSGLIDEVRIMPIEADMKTVVYDQFNRIINMCDGSNHIMKYEYDELGRLTLTRDLQGNIIEKNDYGVQVIE